MKQILFFLIALSTIANAQIKYSVTPIPTIQSFGAINNQDEIVGSTYTTIAGTDQITDHLANRQKVSFCRLKNKQMSYCLYATSRDRGK